MSGTDPSPAPLTQHQPAVFGARTVNVRATILSRDPGLEQDLDAASGALLPARPAYRGNSHLSFKEPSHDR
jgi:hypothetical protein